MMENIMLYAFFVVVYLVPFSWYLKDAEKPTQERWQEINLQSTILVYCLIAK